jgi:adenosylhomocysteine nucleosidase
MNRIALIAALPSELKPLTHHWARNGPIRKGRIGDLEAVAACAGMGAGAVTRACEIALRAGNVDTLVSVGYAGSLSCGLSAPQAVSVREVIDAATGESFPTDPLPNPPNGQLGGQGGAQLKPQRLVTLDHVATPDEKRRLAETHQATLVDMEAATVARFARSKNLGFLCFKAVSDGPSDEFPDFNRFTTPAGQLRMGAFVAWVLWHPQYWRVLGELEKNSHAASHQLAALLQENFASPSAPASVS